MSKELEAFSPQFSEDKEGSESVTPFGVVLYDAGQRVLFLGTTRSGDLRCGYVASTIALDRLSSSGRVQDLSKYTEVVAVQAGLGSIQIGAQRSLLQPVPSLYARLIYHDPRTRKDGQYMLEEHELLDMMIGAGGGIAIFHGGEMPNDNALIIEDRTKTQTDAVLVFFQPADPKFGLDSVTGVYEFFHRLNEEIMQHGRLPQHVRQAIEYLGAAYAAGWFVEDGARLEIFKAQLIGHARYAISGGEKAAKHQEKVLEMIDAIYSLDKGKLRRRMTGTGPDSRRLQAEINKAVAAQLIAYRAPALPSPEEKQRHSGRLDIKDVTLRELYDRVHDGLGEKFGDGRDRFARPVMDRYLVKLVEQFKVFNRLDQLSELEAMLKELSRTGYAKEGYIRCRLEKDVDYLDPKNYDTDRFNANVFVVAQVLNRLLIILAEKKAQALMGQGKKTIAESR